ncbi:MAG: hypothetical protein ACLPY1_06480 [Terracidiphilus sp.]
MADQNPQDPSVEDTGVSDISSAKVDEVPQRPVCEVTDPKGQMTANNGAGSANRVYVYAAIAATFGIVAGLAFALLAGRMSPRSAPQSIGSTNSSAAGLAEIVKPPAPAPADANTPPAELPAAQTSPDPQPKPASHWKAKKKTAVGTEAFAIEGDDEMVGFDKSKGVIQTSARKFSLLSAMAGGDTSAKWQDVPSNIHYKCDLNASCTLSRKGAAVLYAKLQK